MGRAGKSEEEGTQHNICSRRGHSRTSSNAITSPAPEQIPIGTIGPATAVVELPSGQTRGDEGPGRGEFAPPTPAPSALPGNVDIMQGSDGKALSARGEALRAALIKGRNPGHTEANGGIAATLAGNGYRIPLAKIEANPRNHRRFVADQAFESLCDSIRAQGVLQPILVRDHPSKAGCYELLAGERRWRACQKIDPAGGIPATVLTVNDAQAQVVTITENMQRQDLTPIEEGRNIEALLKLGMNVTEAAKAIGRSPAFISRRSRLPRLSERWQKAMGEPNNDVSGWPAAMLELIAVLPTETQDAALKSQVNRRFQNADQLRDYIQREHERQLAKAPWELNVPGIGGIEKCSTCPKQTGNQPDLYPKAAKKGAKYARCLDANCFNGKAHAWLTEHVAAIRKDEPKIKLVTTEWTQHCAELSKKLGAPILGYYDFSPAQKNTPGAVKALVVNGPGCGTTRYVKMRGTPQPQGTRKPSAARIRKEAGQAAARQRGDALITQLWEQTKDMTVNQRLALHRRMGPLQTLRLAAMVHGRHEFADAKAWHAGMIRSESEAANIFWQELLDTICDTLLPEEGLVLEMAKKLGFTLKIPDEPKPAEPAPAKPAAKAKPKARKHGAAGRRAKKAAHKPRKLSRAGQIKILKR